MNVTVMRDRVLIKRIVNEAKTEGGILFTHTGEEKTNQGIVIGVGTGRKTEDGNYIPINLEVGNKVIYDVKAGHSLKMEGVDYIMLKEQDIYAVVEE
jgi:chaperonin GroES